MSFTARQVRQLGRSASPVLGASSDIGSLIAEANRILGFDGWDCAIAAIECVWKSKGAEGFHAVYTAKARLSARAGDITVVREGHGTGEAIATTPGGAHAGALRAAEEDATRHVLATFGKRFGLVDAARSSRSKAPGKSRSPSNGGASVPDVNAPPVSIAREPANQVPPSKATAAAVRPTATPPGKIDKSVLTLSEPKRRRDKDHLRFVARHPCLVCGRTPAQAHHLRYIQPRAVGRKVSDEFTVPLCNLHHSAIHRVGDERGWWAGQHVDPEPAAERLWRESQRAASMGDGLLSEAGLGV